MSNTPNYRGMFLRGYGAQNHNKWNGDKIGNTITSHASGDLGVIQGDAIRNIYGWVNLFAFPNGGTFNYTDQVLFEHGTLYGTHKGRMDGGSINMITGNFILRAHNMVPVANEDRPVNIAVRYLIRTRN